MRNVVVIVGSGGMGAAIAHRLGSGRIIVLSDVSQRNLDATTQALSSNGHDVHARTVDVTSSRSVTELAEYAAAFGPITNLVHTAGVSPEQADVDTILRVDLLGVALVVEQFGEVIESGGSGLVISSMAGHFHPAMDPGVEYELAIAPSRDLLGIPACAPALFGNSQEAYGFAKRANHLRVAAAASAWGQRGARIN
jgi:NAD(P)-dependent dehydrogenase (short-subunit alcohol dehydrogenase family)